jgi:hypothetical protein
MHASAPTLRVSTPRLLHVAPRAGAAARRPAARPAAFFGKLFGGGAEVSARG